MFTSIYCAEAAAKIVALSFRSYIAKVSARGSSLPSLPSHSSLVRELPPLLPGISRWSVTSSSPAALIELRLNGQSMWETCSSPHLPLAVNVVDPAVCQATSPLPIPPSSPPPFQAVNVVDLIVTVASVLQLILDRAGLMGGLHVLRVFQPLKVVTASPSLREVRSRSGSGQA